MRNIKVKAINTKAKEEPIREVLPSKPEDEITIEENQGFYLSTDELPFIMTHEHVAKALHTSKNKTYEIMNSEDFPLIRLGKLMRVEKEDFIEWYRQEKEKTKQLKRELY